MGDPCVQEALLSFFAGRPLAYARYRQTEAFVLQRFPQTTIQVKKSQISFYHRHMYACVSLPVRRLKDWPEHCIVLSFGLARRVDAPRIVQAVEPYPNRWTHHVLLAEASQLDDELAGWLQEAYAFAQCKRPHR
nr:DUF5655 domain-containing protein [Maliibacterium massiliense]